MKVTRRYVSQAAAARGVWAVYLGLRSMSWTSCERIHNLSKKNRPLVLGVSALSTSALPSVLLFKVTANMHSLTRNNDFDKKNVSCIYTPGQTIGLRGPFNTICPEGYRHMPTSWFPAALSALKPKLAVSIFYLFGSNQYSSQH